MPVKDQAAYMREYRAKRKAKPFLEPAMRKAIKDAISPEKLMEAMARVDKEDERIAELEAEVARLKRELAARPLPMIDKNTVGPLYVTSGGSRNPYAEFHPAPKTRGK